MSLRSIIVAALGLIAAALPASEPFAQTRAAAPGYTRGGMRDIMNRNTVTIVTGTPSGTYLQIAYDMAAVLDDGDNMRVIGMLGKGSVQNLKDVLHLRGVDLGIIQSDVLGYFRQTQELGRDLVQRVVYVAKLYNEEVHIVAGRGVGSLADLAGKKVNFAEVGSGTQYSARFLFKLMNMSVQEVNFGQADALLKIKQGEIAATLFVAGRPAAAIARLAKDPDYKLLPIPFTQPLENDYFPAQFTSTDYPNLIEGGQKVETIAVGAVLTAYNWPQGTDRRRRLDAFVDKFFTKFPEFQQGARHPKWKEVNLSARVPGWNRDPAAQAWLDRQSKRSDLAPLTRHAGVLPLRQGADPAGLTP